MGLKEQKHQKDTRNTVTILGMVVLLLIPLFTEVYYQTLYYLLIIFVAVPLGFAAMAKGEALDERFCRKWEAKRRQRKGPVMAREGLKSFGYILLMVLITQFVMEGNTPGTILTKVPGTVLIGLFLFLAVLCGIIGRISWTENEKKYHKIKQQ